MLFYLQRGNFAYFSLSSGVACFAFFLCFPSRYKKFPYKSISMDISKENGPL